MYSKMALITFYEGGDPAFPSHELPGRPAYPSHGLPGGGHISNWVPGMEHPGGGPIYLPVFPFDPEYGKPEGGRPSNELPGGGERPDNSLPSGRPERPSTMPIHPGARFVVRWIACIGLCLVPDNSLPGYAEPKE